MSEMTREVMQYKLNELRMMLNDGEHGEEQEILVEIINELDKAESDSKGDLISRQAVINTIANTCFWLSGDDWNELIECINSIPSIESRGKWIELPKAFDPNENPCKCSKCGHILSFMHGYPKSKFCPNCGANMRGDTDE